MFVRVTSLVLALLVAWVIFARPSSGSQKPGSYIVKPHDTLWKIASHYYGGDPREGVWKISERNHLSGTVIRVGERLVMP
jgi:LysM repeat protein